MASVRQDLHGIFFPILLMPGHPLLGTSENHSSPLLISLRHLTRVWHKALLAKLPAYGFTPSFCKLISSFLSNRFISVVDGATSASFPVSSGVPQGSVLSPTLFLLFINDLHTTASDVHSFADDSNPHKSSSFQCQPPTNARSQSCLAMSSIINSDLQSISEWGTRNLVRFNTSKTQLLTISLSNTPSNYPIIFEDSKILPINSINILGLQISSSSGVSKVVDIDPWRSMGQSKGSINTWGSNRGRQMLELFVVLGSKADIHIKNKKHEI